VEEVLAADHIGHPLQGVVDHNREVIAGRRFPARHDDVTPGIRLRGDPAGLAMGALAALGPGQGGQRLLPQQSYRAAAHEAAPEASNRARSPDDNNFCRARVERRPVRVAPPDAARLPLRDQPRNVGRGSRNSETPAPEPKASQWRCDNRTDARTAAAPAAPRRCRARRDPHRSRPRIPADSGPGRCPRSEAGAGRPTAAPESKFNSAE